ncbi:hypothetical protein DB31_0017 [Hyalangium minutum]|uniref:Uncharacterized protein n=1 Tax=Hyalangium minutum TaxID=394096 RepID=A0A085WVP3_9BACT|nr:hypothetical protein DB31_0017 [Hyalangium minutum]
MEAAGIEPAARSFWRERSNSVERRFRIPALAKIFRNLGVHGSRAW